MHMLGPGVQTLSFCIVGCWHLCFSAPPVYQKPQDQDDHYPLQLHRGRIQVGVFITDIKCQLSKPQPNHNPT